MFVTAIGYCVLNDFRQFAEVLGMKFHGVDMNDDAAWLQDHYSLQSHLLVSRFHKCQAIEFALNPLHVRFDL